ARCHGAVLLGVGPNEARSRAEDGRSSGPCGESKMPINPMRSATTRESRSSIDDDMGDRVRLPFPISIGSTEYVSGPDVTRIRTARPEKSHDAMASSTTLLVQPRRCSQKLA